jgi:hypothetical protein
LRYDGDLAPDLKWLISCVVSQYRHLALSWHELCCRDSQKGGFASAVAAEEGEDLAATN